MPNMDGHTAKKLISENENCGNPLVVALTANCDQVRLFALNLTRGFGDLIHALCLVAGNERPLSARRLCRFPDQAFDHIGSRKVIGEGIRNAAILEAGGLVLGLLTTLVVA